jgi:hypothetical protein
MPITEADSWEIRTNCRCVDDDTNHSSRALDEPGSITELRNNAVGCITIR